MWRVVLWSVALPTWDRRLRILADWLIWPIVGRDVVQMGPSEQVAYDVRHHVYQPGETITESARPGQLVHVIVEGEVEIMGPAGVLETLAPGDHFGRKWLERRRADAARALSVVRTVALHEDQANQLQDVLLSTERIVARTGLFDAESLRRGEPET
jgi:CRP-like cAMP-binding protein